MKRYRPVLLLLVLLLCFTGCGKRPAPAPGTAGGTDAAQTGAAHPDSGQGSAAQAPDAEPAAPVQADPAAAAQEVPLETFLGITLPAPGDVLYIRYDLETEARSFATADPDLVEEVLEETAQILVGSADGSGSGDDAYSILIAAPYGTEEILFDGDELVFRGTAYVTSGGTDLFDTLLYLQEEAEEQQKDAQRGKSTDAPVIERGGIYDRQDPVALHLYAFRSLPSNYMTKKKARSLGWENGSLENYAPGKCIGGDHFGNYEERLPDDDYRECDIGTLGRKSRGAKRIIFTEDYSRVYYTGDHYEHFTLLYGEE